MSSHERRPDRPHLRAPLPESEDYLRGPLDTYDAGAQSSQVSGGGMTFQPRQT